MKTEKPFTGSMVSPETELIQKAQKGDMTAFEHLVQRFDEKVLSMAATYVNNADDAKDIFQEVFVRVYKGLPKFQFRSEFSTWLYRIATNVCLSHSAKRKKRQVLDQEYDAEGDDQGTRGQLLADEGATDQRAIDSDIALHVREALETLSPQQKLVFTLRHYEGYKLKEIASMMDCAEGTVKKYLFTATRRMRDELRGLY